MNITYSIVKKDGTHLINRPDFKQLNVLLDQMIQELLVVDFLSKRRKTTITEKTRQVEVLLTLYPQNKNNDIQNKEFNDLDVEEKITQLIVECKSIFYESKQANLYAQYNEWYLTYHLWRISNQGVIHILEPLVNSIAEISNRLRNTKELLLMHDCIQQILSDVADEYKDDMLNSDPRRPWRVLLLNYGIIATRTHNSQLIEKTYDYFFKHLPEDTMQFFTEAMSLMAAQNYPQSVCDIVEKYYQKYAINKAYEKQID